MHKKCAVRCKWPSLLTPPTRISICSALKSSKCLQVMVDSWTAQRMSSTLLHPLYSTCSSFPCTEIEKCYILSITTVTGFNQNILNVKTVKEICVQLLMYQKILRTRFISTCPFCGFLHACKHVCACGSPLANSGHTQRQASVNSGIAQLSVWKRKTGVCASLLHHHTHSMHSSEALRPLSLSVLPFKGGLCSSMCVQHRLCNYNITQWWNKCSGGGVDWVKITRSELKP